MPLYGEKQFHIINIPRLASTGSTRSPGAHGNAADIAIRHGVRRDAAAGKTCQRADSLHRRFRALALPAYLLLSPPPTSHDEELASYRYLTDRVRYVGDVIALIAAESRELAEEAKKLIRVEYDILPAVFDVREAQKPGAHTFCWRTSRQPLHPLPLYAEKGDPEAGFAKRISLLSANTKRSMSSMSISSRKRRSPSKTRPRAR
jgi:hypothetical protein